MNRTMTNKHRPNKSSEPVKQTNPVNADRNIALDVGDNNAKVYIDNVLALVATHTKRGMKLNMLPDLYTFTDFLGHNDVKSVHIDIHSPLSVSVNTDYESYDDVLLAINKAALDINLYGYTTEE